MDCWNSMLISLKEFMVRAPASTAAFQKGGNTVLWLSVEVPDVLLYCPRSQPQNHSGEMFGTWQPPAGRPGLCLEPLHGRRSMRLPDRDLLRDPSVRGPAPHHGRYIHHRATGPVDSRKLRATAKAATFERAVRWLHISQLAASASGNGVRGMYPWMTHQSR